MLHHPTLDQLNTLRLTGMATALTEQMALPDMEALAFEERLGLLVGLVGTKLQKVPSRSVTSLGSK